MEKTLCRTYTIRRRASVDHVESAVIMVHAQGELMNTEVIAKFSFFHPHEQLVRTFTSSNSKLLERIRYSQTS